MKDGKTLTCKKLCQSICQHMPFHKQQRAPVLESQFQRQQSQVLVLDGLPNHCPLFAGFVGLILETDQPQPML